MHRTISTGCMLLCALLFGQVGFAAPGDTVQTFPVPLSCPQGLCFDGTYLWNADRKSDMIYKITPADGKVVDSLPAPGYIPVGLTWDGARLWCVDGGEGLIFAINPETRIVEQTIYCPISAPGDLAWGDGYLWISDDGGDQIHQISSEDGTTIVSIPAPSSHPGGLAYDGTYLWVSDRYKDMIYMVTPDKGDVIVSLKAPGPHGAGLTYDGANLWSVDYETDLIYKLVVDDGTKLSRSNEKHEQVEFVHQVRNYGPGTLNTLDVYLAVPHNLDNQELVGPVTFDPEPEDILTDKWGQKVAHFRFTDLGPARFTNVTMLAEAKLYETRYFVFPDKVGKLDDIPPEIREAYLIDDTKFSKDNPIIQKALKAALGDETNPYWIARKIYNYLIEHLEYERVGGWNIAPTVLERGNGSCSEYTFVYISMCRAAGLPARYAGSVVIRGDDASWDDVYHRWVEVYLPGYGWMPVDPSGGDSESPSTRADYFGHLNNRFLITTTGGGGSEYLAWGYNANEVWTSTGRCKIVAEAFGEWSPVKPPADQ
ncbi:MAG TPA: transglutaminase domain-containing protein [Acidobacteriota bacterium]|nr:transglutaminase domain-containing protein [Acidobacteriota bacterium]